MTFSFETILNFLTGFPGIILSFFALVFIFVLLITLFERSTEKKFWSRVNARWMHFAEILATLVMSTVLGILYIFIIPFFVLFFVKKDELLGQSLEEDSFWSDSKPVSFELGRNYKLY